MQNDRYRKVYSTLPAAGVSVNPAHAPRIQLERKGRGGKSVTVIEGLARSDDELRKLLKELQQACGTGGTVKEHHLELQGDFQTMARTWWEARARKKI